MMKEKRSSMFTQSVIKTYLLHNEAMEDILMSAPEENGMQSNRFKCNFPGCQKTFVHAGPLRRKLCKGGVMV